MTSATSSSNQASVRFRLAAVGPRLDGIAGYNFLRRAKVALDYPNETRSLFTP